MRYALERITKKHADLLVILFRPVLTDVGRYEMNSLESLP